MSANVTTLGLAVDSTGVRRATDDLRTMAAQGAPTATAAAGVSRSMRDVSDDARSAGGQVGGFASSMRALQGVMALGVVAKAAREFIQMADSAKLAASRLELVTGAGENLATVQAQLYAMAQRTSSAYGETSDTYAKLARASGQLRP